MTVFDSGPEPAGWEDSAAYRQEQRYAEATARQQRARIAAENTAKMRQLRARLESGELDAADPARRWWHGLALGEQHGDRELAQLGRQLDRYMAEDESDPRAVLAWLNDHKSYNGGAA